MADYFISTTIVNYSYYIFKKKDSNGLCVSTFIKCMVWYLVVMGKIHGDEYLIYIFTGEVLNGTPKIFTNSQYVCL